MSACPSSAIPGCVSLSELLTPGAGSCTREVQRRVLELEEDKAPEAMVRACGVGGGGEWAVVILRGSQESSGIFREVLES